jgi:hypothetical protein
MSSFAAHGRLEPPADLDPTGQLIYLRWLWGRRVLADPTVTTPAGHLRHGVLEQLTGKELPPSRTGRRSKQRTLSPELLADLAEIQGQIDILSGTARRGRAGDVGHVYVIQFSTGVVKVGKAVNPESRIGDHRHNAAVHNISITDGFVSVAHPGHSKTERELIKFCAHHGTRTAAGNEYFTGIDFEAACSFADEIVGRRVRAAGLAA